MRDMIFAPPSITLLINYSNTFFLLPAIALIQPKVHLKKKYIYKVWLLFMTTFSLVICSYSIYMLIFLQPWILMLCLWTIMWKAHKTCIFDQYLALLME